MKSTEPNIQNIPVRTKIAKDLRKAFITGELFRGDYSQLELRVLAEFQLRKEKGGK